jgi:hypothetical protein
MLKEKAAADSSSSNGRQQQWQAAVRKCNPDRSVVCWPPTPAPMGCLHQMARQGQATPHPPNPTR